MGRDSAAEETVRVDPILKSSSPPMTTTAVAMTRKRSKGEGWLGDDRFRAYVSVFQNT